jgi:branched-chain amino acid aminotransferase
LEDHLDRLYNSAAGIHMTPPMSRDRLRPLLVEIVEKNLQAGYSDPLLVDVLFSGGLEGSTMKKSASGAHLYVAVQKMEPPPPELYQNGVGLAAFTHQRMLPDVKLLNYVGAILAHQLVVPQHDAYDVVFLCPTDGRTILEGSTFTVFFVDAEGVIRTPPLDGRILDSVTRRVVLEIIAKEPRLSLKEAPIGVDAVSSFAEAFLVSTTRNVLPVVRIDGTMIGNGSPGPVTQQLMRAFDDYIDSY